MRARAFGTTIGLVIAGILLLETPSAANTSYEDLAWTHASPANLSGFKVILSSKKGERKGAEELDVGKPAHAGVFRWSLGVHEGQVVWVCVVAVDRQGRESDPSEWRKLEWNPKRVRLLVPARPYLVQVPES